MSSRFIRKYFATAFAVALLAHTAYKSGAQDTRRKKNEPQARQNNGLFKRKRPANRWDVFVFVRAYSGMTEIGKCASR
jgi:hypothetical protein